MRGYKRTLKKQVNPISPVVENGQITGLSIDLEELAEHEGYKSVEDFMLHSNILDRFNSIKHQYCKGARIIKCWSWKYYYELSTKTLLI